MSRYHIAVIVGSLRRDSFNRKLADAIVKLAAALSRNKANGAVSYGTEGGLFQQAGIPTVICGPGDIAQAHRPNEFATLAQLAQCEAFMLRLIASESSVR